GLDAAHLRCPGDGAHIRVRRLFISCNDNSECRSDATVSKEGGFLRHASPTLRGDHPAVKRLGHCAIALRTRSVTASARWMYSVAAATSARRSVPTCGSVIWRRLISIFRTAASSAACAAAEATPTSDTTFGLPLSTNSPAMSTSRLATRATPAGGCAASTRVTWMAIARSDFSASVLLGIRYAAPTAAKA